MALDIYAGTLTRYYTKNWKTATQKFAEENGFEYNLVTENEGEFTMQPQEILEGVLNWKNQLLSDISGNFNETVFWKEDIEETPYYTDKIGWTARGALLLYIACKNLNKEIPLNIDRDFDVSNDPIFQEYVNSTREVNTLVDYCEWWIPLQEQFIFKYPAPNGNEIVIGTVGMLKSELEKINNLEWKATNDEIINWSNTEGYSTNKFIQNGKLINVNDNPVDNTISLAKFAFSILWQAVEFSKKNGTVILHDY